MRDLCDQALSRPRDSQDPQSIDLGMLSVDQAIERGLPFRTMLMDSWYLSREVVKHLK